MWNMVIKTCRKHIDPFCYWTGRLSLLHNREWAENGKIKNHFLSGIVNPERHRYTDFCWLFSLFLNRNRFNSEKRCTLSYANIQGKKALVDKFRNSSVMDEEASYQPKIFVSTGEHRGEEEPFPQPTLPSELRKRKQRQSLTPSHRSSTFLDYYRHNETSNSGDDWYAAPSPSQRTPFSRLCRSLPVWLYLLVFTFCVYRLIYSLHSHSLLLHLTSHIWVFRFHSHHFSFSVVNCRWVDLIF